MDLTRYFRKRIIDHMLRNVAHTPPTVVYLALFTTATTDVGGGTEVTGGSYARQPVTLSAAADPGLTANTNALTFGNLPAVTVTNAALYDALTGGNMLMHAALPLPKSVALGGSVTVAIGDVDVVLQ